MGLPASVRVLVMLVMTLVPAGVVTGYLGRLRRSLNWTIHLSSTCVLHAVTSVLLLTMLASGARQ